MDGMRRVKCFDLVKKTRQEIAHMNYKRAYVSVSVLNNSIYTMGGQDTLNRVECYDPDANRCLISSMLENK